MALVMRERLSVQRVEEWECESVRVLAERGGDRGKERGQAEGKRAGTKKDEDVEEERDDTGDAEAQNRRREELYIASVGRGKIVSEITRYVAKVG